MDTNIKNNLQYRQKVADELVSEYTARNAASVTFIQGGCGQGKTYIIEYLFNKLKNNKNIKVYRNVDDKFVSDTRDTISNINSLSVSGGGWGFSLGLDLGLNNNDSNYTKIRNLLSARLKSNILICVENMSDVSDDIRLFISSIIKNISMLENEFNKKIFILITDTQKIYLDTIYKLL